MFRERSSEWCETDLLLVAVNLNLAVLIAEVTFDLSHDIGSR